MARKLKLAKNLSLPLDAVTETFAFLAKRGAGKSYCASVMVEEMLEARLQEPTIKASVAWPR